MRCRVQVVQPRPPVQVRRLSPSSLPFSKAGLPTGGSVFSDRVSTCSLSATRLARLVELRRVAPLLLAVARSILWTWRGRLLCVQPIRNYANPLRLPATPNICGPRPRSPKSRYASSVFTATRCGGRRSRYRCALMSSGSHPVAARWSFRRPIRTLRYPPARPPRVRAGWRHRPPSFSVDPHVEPVVRPVDRRDHPGQAIVRRGPDDPHSRSDRNALHRGAPLLVRAGGQPSLRSLPDHAGLGPGTG